MNQILSNNEIAQVVHDIDCAKVRPFDIEFARAIEQAILNKLSEQEPVEIEYPDYHHSGMVCDLEDQGITDRYQAMKYGWDCAIGAMQERIPEDLFEQPIPSVPEGFDAWCLNPYTVALQKSIANDYVPKPPISEARSE